MGYYYHRVFLSSVLLILVAGCQKKDTGNIEDAGVKALKTYHTLMSDKNLLLGLPVRLKYDDETQHLFIQDLAKWSVTEVDDSNKVVNVYGSRGNGPGEIQQLADFFITPKHLFIVDGSQYLINKYSRQNGHYISSLDYGKFLLKEENTSKNNIPTPPSPPLNDNNNKPFVTLNETVLVPSQANGKFLYELISWKGDKLVGIGEIPKGYTATENKEKIRSDLQNKKVPARDLCKVFPVNDSSDPKDIYLVYSAIPKIAKYSLSGRKIWEHNIPTTPEVDSLMIDLSKVVKSHTSRLWPVRKYITGRSSSDGDLYLITYNNWVTPQTPRRPIWIHHFNLQGKLISRYKIVSDSVDLSNYPGIDFKRRKIFVTFIKDIGVRTYQF